MDLQEAETLALETMQKYGLDDWHFEWTRAKSFIGDCSHSVKRLRLSKPLTEANDVPVILDTVLHEIAHALVGPGVKHGPEWKAMARKLGAHPRHAAERGTVAAPPKRYRADHHCGRTFRRDRMPSSNLYCSKCLKASGHEYSAETVLRWTDTRTMTEAGTSTGKRAYQMIG